MESPVRIWIGMLFFAVAIQAAAADMERVLLPITVLDVPGAHGSVWRSEFWAHIRVPGVVILPLRISDAQPLPAGSQTVPIFLHDANETPGQFIQVTRELLEGVDFNLRVRDRSRAGETWGTEIPVVRESEFRSGPIALLPLAVEPAFRNTVRIYVANEDGGDVIVRVTLIDPETHANRIVYESTHRCQPTGSLFHPSYAQISIEGLVSGDEQGVARVDIEPVSSDLRIWAFASTTDNATQHFTTITPQ